MRAFLIIIGLSCLIALGAQGAHPASVVFGNFCVNQTSNVITFTADVTSLYNVTNPATQWSSIGDLLTYPTLSTELQCTSLSAIETGLPSTVPQPIQTFINDINRLNVYNFIFPGVTQNTYQPLNTKGPVVAVQMINDYTTGNVLKMRFFYKINLLTAGNNCSGISFEGATDGTNNVTIFRSIIPVNVFSRDSTGQVQRSTGGIVIVASRETAGADLVLSISEGSSLYNFDTFLEKAVIQNTGCAAGHSRALLSIGVAYTAASTTGLALVQGPLTAADVAIVPNLCYNYTVVKFTRPVCSSNSSCVGQIQVATQCRPSTSSFLNCPSVTESSLLNLAVQARECTGTRTRPRNCTGAGTAVSNGQDGVSSSIDFASSIAPVYAVHAYDSLTALFDRPLTSASTGNSTTEVDVALFAQGPDNAEFIPVAINTTSLVFTLTDASGLHLLTGASYSDFVTAGFFVNGVKATSDGYQSLTVCANIEGCDSFTLNKTSLGFAYHSVALAYVSGIVAQGAAESTAQSIVVAVVEMLTYPDRKPYNAKVIQRTFAALGAIAAAGVVAAVVVVAVYAPTAGLVGASAAAAIL